MKRSTYFLRFAAIAVGLLVVLLSGLVFHAMLYGWSQEYPPIAYARFPFMAAIAISLPLFLTALMQAWRLLGYLDRKQAFSIQSIVALRRIKYLAWTMSAALLLCLPFIFLWAELDDAPGLIIIGLIFSAAPMVVGVFADLLQNLIQNALDFKSENDLTV